MQILQAKIEEVTDASRLVPDGKDVPAVERDGRLEFEAMVRLHSIYEIA